MAEPSPSGRPEPREFVNSRGITAIYIPGVFSSILDLKEMFDGPMEGMSAHTSMKSAIAKCKDHDFQHMQVPFPVKSLQHVTAGTALRGIVDREGFIPLTDGNIRRFGFKDLSFLSAKISAEDIEIGRQQAKVKVTRVIRPEDAQTYQNEIQKQFATSPAFDMSSSRYGQYKFSFPLSDLLSWYGDQFCQGGEPQLRILGTETYRQEIAHYIVVHGPDTDLYNEFPMVPTEENSPGFVYWMGNTLYWRPESTSNLYVRILTDGSVRKECYRNCSPESSGPCIHIDSGIYSPWNHLVFAFHIPPGNLLKISRQDLLDNVTPCEDDIIYLGKRNESDPNPSEVIRKLKEEFPANNDN